MNRVVLALAILLIAFGSTAQTTNGLSEAEVKGQALAQEILQQTPVRNLTESGTLRIEASHGMTTNTPVTVSTSVNNGYWETRYDAVPTNYFGDMITLKIVHKNGQPNEYFYRFQPMVYTAIPANIDKFSQLSQSQIMAPFADSDFWIADLGLEFFHWPEQKVLRHEDRRTRACTVLESTNPNPDGGGYSRVVSWIDDESQGIVYAEAYDLDGKLLKEFEPKSFKKVNGQWELQDMEIQNRQTRSRTWIKFDLK